MDGKIVRDDGNYDSHCIYFISDQIRSELGIFFVIIYLFSLLSPLSFFITQPSFSSSQNLTSSTSSASHRNLTHNLLITRPPRRMLLGDPMSRTRTSSNTINKLRFDSRSNVIEPAGRIPVYSCEKGDGDDEDGYVVHLFPPPAHISFVLWMSDGWKRKEGNGGRGRRKGRGKGTTYIRLIHRPDRRLHINNRHKRSPHHGPDINRFTRPAQMERPPFEPAIRQFTNNRNTIAPIERDGRQIENRADGRIAAQADQIDQHTAEDEEPDCVERGVCFAVNAVPDSAERQHFVPSVSPDRATAGLDGGHGGEIQHDEGGDGEEDPAAAADDVVEDLRHRLRDYVAVFLDGVAEAVG